MLPRFILKHFVKVLNKLPTIYVVMCKFMIRHLALASNVIGLYSDAQNIVPDKIQTIISRQASGDSFNEEHDSGVSIN